MKTQIKFVNKIVEVRGYNELAKVERTYIDNFGLQVALVRFVKNGSSIEALLTDLKITTTAEHTKGEPQRKDFESPSIAGDGFVKVDWKGYTSALKNYIAENRKAVNMHDELVRYKEQYIKVCDAINFPPDAPFNEVINYLKKQAEQK